jgi:hypothetical protein
MTDKELKVALLDHCKETVENRFDKIKQTITAIEESLEDESKSSAGDKHETGRAMLQIDRENAGKQLHEIESLQALVKKIDSSAVSDYIRLGSLVHWPGDSGEDGLLLRGSAFSNWAVLVWKEKGRGCCL